MIQKVSEIEVTDELRMIRQNEFIDIAIPKAVKFLKENPFVGEMYEGELLEKLSRLERSALKQYIQDLREVLGGALNKNKTYEWLDEEERIDFQQVINDFIEKITAK